MVPGYHLLGRNSFVTFSICCCVSLSGGLMTGDPDRLVQHFFLQLDWSSGHSEGEDRSKQHISPLSSSQSSSSSHFLILVPFLARLTAVTACTTSMVTTASSNSSITVPPLHTGMGTTVSSILPGMRTTDYPGQLGTQASTGDSLGRDSLLPLAGLRMERIGSR